MYKLAIFDLDGTILDTLQDLADALNHTLSAYSYPLKTVRQTQAMIGHGLRNLVRDATGSGDEVLVNEMLSELVAYYSEHSADKTAPYSGIVEMIGKLREAGIRTAVLSNKRDEVTRFLCSHFFPGLFDICRGERSGIPIKPSPESVHSIMSELGVDASDTVYIGDSEVDITTARNAGTDCFIVTWGFRSREDLVRSGADRLFDDVPSLFDALTSID